MAKFTTQEKHLVANFNESHLEFLVAMSFKLLTGSDMLLYNQESSQSVTPADVLMGKLTLPAPWTKKHNTLWAFWEVPDLHLICIYPYCTGPLAEDQPDTNIVIVRPPVYVCKEGRGPEQPAGPSRQIFLPVHHVGREQGFSVRRKPAILFRNELRTVNTCLGKKEA